MFLHSIILLWKKNTSHKHDTTSRIRYYVNPCPMKTILLILLFSLIQLAARSQEEFSKAPYISIFTGLINYQGDLNPNSFTIGHSQFAAGVSIRKPLSRWFVARAGINIGKIEAADR